MSDAALSLLLARWFEGRLHDSVGFCFRGCRLYGLELIDAELLEQGDPVAARVSFIAEADNREAVLAHGEAPRALGFDAAALVTVEWRPSIVLRTVRPGEFSGRRRARVVQLVAGDEGATVIRFENDPDFVVLAPAS